MDSSIEMAAACSLGILEKVKALIHMVLIKIFCWTIQIAHTLCPVPAVRVSGSRSWKGKGKAEGIFFR